MCHDVLPAGLVPICMSLEAYSLPLVVSLAWLVILPKEARPIAEYIARTVWLAVVEMQSTAVRCLDRNRPFLWRH